MNRYPAWKYFLIVFVLLFATVYALPNIYPEDPAIQVSNVVDGTIGDTIMGQVTETLDKKKVAWKSMAETPQGLVIRFHNADTQLLASSLLRDWAPPGYIVALNLATTTPGWLRSLNAAPMNLGLDLRGGVHFLLEVDVVAAREKAIRGYHNELRALFRKEKLRYRKTGVTADSISFSFASQEERDTAVELVKTENPTALTPVEENPDPLKVIFQLSEAAIKELSDFAVQQNIVTLRKRVNELGVAEPTVTRQGRDRIVVQLPGVQDTARAKDILGATATLEFRLVAENEDAVRAVNTNVIPRNTKLYYERNGDPILLKRRVMLSGEYITGASSGIDSENGRPAVHITLDGKGARLFSKVTGENVKRLMAVVFIENKSEKVKTLSGETRRRLKTVEEVINVARIQEQLGKRFQITGLDSTREARKLSLLLRSGALAAPMQIVEERTVGPSLGQDNIDQGQRSVLLAFLLVILFMGIYYRTFGMLANLALLANIVLIIAIMSLIPGATLTLPGIVGIVLTVGMAVDANVLIFERIREHLKEGHTPQVSIDSGYRQALSTIADANLTTLIAAVVLFTFGTGPIKGFAVTLSIGILCSMFTAIMGTRAIANLIYGRKREVRLAI